MQVGLPSQQGQMDPQCQPSLSTPPGVASRRPPFSHGFSLCGPPFLRMTAHRRAHVGGGNAAGLPTLFLNDGAPLGLALQPPTPSHQCKMSSAMGLALPSRKPPPESHQSAFSHLSLQTSNPKPAGGTGEAGAALQATGKSAWSSRIRHTNIEFAWHGTLGNQSSCKSTLAHPVVDSLLWQTLAARPPEHRHKRKCCFAECIGLSSRSLYYRLDQTAGPASPSRAAPRAIELAQGSPLSSSYESEIKNVVGNS